MLIKREIYKLDLPHRAVAVYMYLCDRADENGECFPAIHTIAEELNFSESTIRRALRNLENEKLIRQEIRTRKNGGQSSNLIKIL